MNKEEIVQLFHKYDTDNSNSISFDEFKNVIAFYFSIEEITDEINNMIEDVFNIGDGNGLFNRKDNVLTLREFTKIVKLFPSFWLTPKEGICHLLFNFIDKDQTGVISVRELKTYFKRIGADFSKKEFEAILEKMDIDGSKVVNFNEFFLIYH